jgi:cyanate permease
MARRGIGRFAVHDTKGSRAIAWAGVGTSALGVVGLIFLPELLLVWVILIGFGAATIPRAVLEWLSERRGRRS